MLSDRGNLRKIIFTDYCNASVEIIQKIMHPGELSSHVDAVKLLYIGKPKTSHFRRVTKPPTGEALALITTAKAQQGQEIFRKKVMTIGLVGNFVE